MADSEVTVTQGSGTNIDTRTESTNSQHRQVIVVGDPATNDSVAIVRASDPDSNAEGVVVRDPNTTTVVSGLRDVRVQSLVDGTVSVGRPDINRVHNVVDGTMTTLTRVDRVHNIVDGTISLPSTQNLDTITRVDRVFNLVDGTVSLPSTQDLDTITRVDRVFNIVDGTIDLGSRPDIQRVHNVVDGTIDVGNRPDVNIVHNLVDGTVSISGTPSVQDLSGTTTAYYTSAGSASGVSASGNTVVSPATGRVNKIYALQLTTTAQVHVVATFEDGGGGTEFWRYALQAPSAGIAGANLSVTPPAFLFATGSGDTLTLNLDTGSLVHYSVSYFRESA